MKHAFMVLCFIFYEASLGMLTMAFNSDRSVLICIGFHRSATSVTGHWLYDAGLDMGKDLMPGGISNPFGHFEDFPAVKMHDEWLANAGISWQFHGDVPLKVKSSHIEQLKQYIDFRDSFGDVWGVKDPRVCLFLPEWAEQLGERGRYLVVLRHWASCIESLFKRHSEQIAFPVNEQALNENIAFWEQPTLAARMWLAYCKRIVAFLQKRSEQSLVVTQKELFSGINLPELINNKLGFALSTDVPSPITPSLISDAASVRVKQMLPVTLVNELNDVWHKLLSFTHGINCVDENIVWRDNEDTGLSDMLPLHNKVTHQGLDESVNPSVCYISLSQFREQLKEFSEPEACVAWLDKLNNANPSHNKHDTVNFVIQYVCGSELSNHREVILALARWVGKQNEMVLAEECWQLCVGFKPVPAYVYNALTQCEFEKGNLQLAIEYNQLAIKINPNNPHFWLMKAKLAIITSAKESSFNACHQALVVGKNSPQIVALASARLDELGETEQAISMLDDAIQEFDNPPKLLWQTYVRLKLKSKASDAPQCVKHYKQALYSGIKDTAKYLVVGCQRAGSRQAENDFYTRVTAHWRTNGQT